MAPLLASITDPNIVQPTGISLPSVVPFENFEAVLEPDDEEFDLYGEFALGAASNGIDPKDEDVTLQIGSFSVIIPAGSFDADDGAFEFEGVIDGVELEVEIELIMDRTYSFEAEGDGVDPSTEPDPVTIVLTIGDDRGETTDSSD